LPLDDLSIEAFQSTAVVLQPCCQPCDLVDAGDIAGGNLFNLCIDLWRRRLGDLAGDFSEGACMSSDHFGQLAWQFKRMSGSSRLKVQAAIAC